MCIQGQGAEGISLALLHHKHCWVAGIHRRIAYAWEHKRHAADVGLGVRELLSTHGFYLYVPPDSECLGWIVYSWSLFGCEVHTRVYNYYVVSDFIAVIFLLISTPPSGMMRILPASTGGMFKVDSLLLVCVNSVCFERSGRRRDILRLGPPPTLLLFIGVAPAGRVPTSGKGAVHFRMYGADPALIAQFLAVSENCFRYLFCWSFDSAPKRFSVVLFMFIILVIIFAYLLFRREDFPYFVGIDIPICDR